MLADLGANPAARPVVGIHVAVAILGTIGAPAVAAFGSSSAVAFAALAVLLVGIGFGITTLANWTTAAAGAVGAAGAAGKKVSNGMLVADGAGAALTTLFVLLAAWRHRGRPPALPPSEAPAPALTSVT